MPCRVWQDPLYLQHVREMPTSWSGIFRGLAEHVHCCCCHREPFCSHTVSGFLQAFTPPFCNLEQVFNYLHMTLVTAMLTEYDGMPGADGFQHFLLTFQIIFGLPSVDFSNL